jgi:hypothetical protein
VSLTIDKIYNNHCTNTRAYLFNALAVIFVSVLLCRVFFISLSHVCRSYQTAVIAAEWLSEREKDMMYIYLSVVDLHDRRALFCAL